MTTPRTEREDTVALPPAPEVPPDAAVPDPVPSAAPVVDVPLHQADAHDPAPLTGKVRRGDRIFAALAAGSSSFVIILVVLVALFLLIKALPAIADDKVNFLTSTEWNMSRGNLRFGVAALLY